jgi:hypothetical protein
MWMAIIYFISLADYGMNPVFMVVGTYIYRHRQPVQGKNVAQTAACHMPVIILMRN